jgi:hypothetical protein
MGAKTLPLKFLVGLLRNRCSGSTVQRWKREGILDADAIG